MFNLVGHLSSVICNFKYEESILEKSFIATDGFLSVSACAIGLFAVITAAYASSPAAAFIILGIGAGGMFYSTGTIIQTVKRNKNTLII